MKVIGIDPGKSGGCVLLDGQEFVQSFALPLDELHAWSPRMVTELAWSWKLMGVEKVAIEVVQAFPGMSAASMSQTILGYGIWLGGIGAAFKDSEVLRVYSTTWRAGLGIKKVPGRSGQEAREVRKQQCLELARTTFKRPFMTPKGRSLDGEAEAALIALWALKQSISKTVEELPLFGGTNG